MNERAIGIRDELVAALHQDLRPYPRTTRRSTIHVSDVVAATRGGGGAMTHPKSALAPRSMALAPSVAHRAPICLVRAHPLAAFFIGAFVLSWSYWIPNALAGGHWSHYPGLVGPAVSAIVVAMICGSPARDALRDCCTRWRVAPRWYAAALAPLLTAALVVAISAAVGSAPSFAALSTIKGLPAVGWLPVALLLLVVDGFGEEIGWRGFAWPRLHRDRSLVAAAAVITIPWALWHVPLLWIDSGFRELAPVAFPGFVFSLFAGAIVLGWLFDKTASVAVVALWHTMLNMATASAAAGAAAAIVSMTVVVFAIAIVEYEARGRHARSTDAGLASTE